MSRIIKSMAVVDDRPDAERFVIRASDQDFGHVIKRQSLGRQPDAFRRPPVKDELLDELNRLRIQIDDAEKELSAARHEAAAARLEMEAILEERAALDRLLDGATAEEKARQILRDAETQAVLLMEQTTAQAAEAVDRLKAQGYLDGLEQGASEAREQYRQEHTPDMEKLGRLMEELTGLRQSLVDENEREILELITAVAEQVIGKKLEDDPAVIADMLRAVMEQNRRETFIKVTVSPDLLPAEAKACGKILKLIEGLGHQVEVIADPDSGPGGLVVETPGGLTDLTLSTQLGNLRETLRGEE